MFGDKPVDQVDQLSLSLLFLFFRQKGMDLVVHQFDPPEGFSQKSEDQMVLFKIDSEAHIGDEHHLS